MGLLLEKGADINAKDPFLGSPLNWAVENESLDMVKLLLEKKADVHATTKTGLTPLHLAAQSGREELVSLLLNKGADIAAQHIRGRSVLELAKESEKENVVHMLSVETDSAATSPVGAESRSAPSLPAVAGSITRNNDRLSNDRKQPHLPLRPALKNRTWSLRSELGSTSPKHAKFDTEPQSFGD